jgi:predicted RNA-binding protein YlxR (DUF448 family)
VFFVELGCNDEIKDSFFFKKGRFCCVESERNQPNQKEKKNTIKKNLEKNNHNKLTDNKGERIH